MNIKDLVIPTICAFAMVIALNYFFPSGSSKETVESSFIAPRDKKEYRPLNVEVDFFDQKRAPQKMTELVTDWATLQFSTDGASLESIDFNRELDGKITTIRTVFPLADTDRENRCFLVGLQEKTPFYYSLLSAQEHEGWHELIYAASNDECVVQKIFLVHKNKPKIDLLLEIAPKSGEHMSAEQPRILFPAPIMPDLKDTDVISAILIDQTHVFSKKSVAKVDVHQGWFKPELFGADNRYFIHAMIADINQFAQRSYYKLENRQLFSILEGPSITEKTTWEVSFYFGPKELTAINSVDARLEKTLDYSGVLSSLAKLMLYILNWLYKYLHNYGFAIIVLTLLIQILLLPLSLRNNEEKFRKQHMEYQRQLAYIEQRFKDKPEQLLAERTELIRKHGLPGFGCLLPLLIQIPLFVALSRVLSSSFELYQAPMLWIPDLSQRDPYYILAIIFILTMLLTQDTKGEPQQRMSKMLMALVFGALTASVSAGLALYICSSRVFSFVQSKLMNFFKLV